MNKSRDSIDLSSLARYEPGKEAFEMDVVEAGRYVRFSAVEALIQLARCSTSGSTNPMCERKTDDIIQREGYQKTGYVLMKDDPAARICVSDQGAVSWFTREQWNWLMHNRNHVEFRWPKPIGAKASGSDGTAAVGSEVLPTGWKAFPPELDDTLLRAAISGFRPALNKMTGQDSYVVRQTYAALFAAAPDNRAAATSGSEPAPAQQAATCQPLADERALPSLPEPRVRSMNPLDKPTAFTADQTREYGTACARAALAHQSPSIEVAYGGKDQSGPFTRVIPANSVTRNPDGSYTAFIDSPSIDQQGGAPAIGYAVYGIDGWGEHYVHDVKPADADGEWKTDDDGLGDRWAGNEALGVIAAPSPAARADQDAIDADRYRQLRDGHIKGVYVWDDRGEICQECGDYISGENLDVVIDAAMSQAKGAGKDGAA